jgi:glyoxylase-like metal-dependent hydrolase (beta-lactamase superfamily II)
VPSISTELSYVDLNFCDTPKSIATGVYASSDGIALVDPGPGSCVDNLRAALQAQGIRIADVTSVLLTHIHLDHAGATGLLVRENPRIKVFVHEKGAPHVIDPSKLVNSANQLWGVEGVAKLWGPVLPVPGANLTALRGGERITAAAQSFEVKYTPGHASHHVSLVDSRTGALFTGDALGIHLPDVRVLRPATPPPDVDVELGVESIERIRTRAETYLMFSHFGPVQEVDELCAIAATRLRSWADIVREAMDGTDDLARIAEILEQRTASEFDDAPPEADLERYEILSGMEMNAAGLVRYWNKRRETEARAPSR